MNIFDKMMPSAPTQRTAFDLDQRHIYSAKVGQDLPILSLDLLPKDYVEVDVLSLVRSMPINTSAYARLKARFQFIFVPYEQLWHGWNQFFLQTQQNMSVGTSFTMSECPHTSFKKILGWIYYEAAICKSVWMDIFDDSRRELPANPSDDDRRQYLVDNHLVDDYGNYVYQNAVRLLDLLGYGNFIGVANAGEKLAATYEAWQQEADPQNYLQELELYIQNTDDAYTGSYDREVNLWRLLAYHKAWQDYFMNKRVQPYDATFFNVDNMTDISFSTAAIFKKYFTLHYHPWSYDMFTGLYTSPQDGDVSLINGSSSFNIVADSAPSSVAPLQVSGASATTPAPGTVYVGGSGARDFHLSPNTGISVYDIKRAEYLQHWKENKLRAGHKLQSQAKAQWNARFKYLSDEYSEFIGETILNISIDEVVNTAQDQGNISGKGIGTTNGKIKFSTEDAGVLLCICSITPSQEYNALMMDKQNTCIDPFDYPSPFFDKLGFEAIYASQVNFLNRRCWADPSANQDNFDDVLGYAPRYAAWKTSFDKVHGLFMNTGFVSDVDTTTIGDPQQEHQTFELYGRGSLAAWTMPRRDIIAGEFPVDSHDARFYYIAPDVANDIFGVDADSTQDTDHFLFNTNFVVRLVRNLSGLGLPSWNS